MSLNCLHDEAFGRNGFCVVSRKAKSQSYCPTCGFGRSSNITCAEQHCTLNQRFGEHRLVSLAIWVIVENPDFRWAARGERLLFFMQKSIPTYGNSPR